MPKYLKQEGGAVPLLLLLAAVGLMAFLLISNTFNFKDRLFNTLFPKPTSRAATIPQAELIPNQYIVVLNDKDESGNKIDPEIEASNAVKEQGITKQHVYTHAPLGYSFHGSVQAADALRKSPHVKFVSQDRKVHTDQKVKTTSSPTPTATPTLAPSATPIALPADTPQTLPTGITRVAADKNPTANINGVDDRVNVNVAILDSGIDTTHPDLNVVGGVNCSSQVTGWNPAYLDGFGHGTKVAGIVGALDNSVGVVGVAPGVNLYAVRVLNNGGGGTLSDVICGVDWATATRTDTDSNNDIAVANMSLYGGDASDNNCGLTNNDALHTAICNSTNAGVLYVVSAGNSNSDAFGQTPAGYPEVLTVSAIADSDGKSGHLGSTIGLQACGYFNPSGCPDDTLADFSNFGQAVDVAAPGVEILSTCLIWPSGSTSGNSSLPPYCMDPYASTGTSFSAPHVTGAVALYIANNGMAHNGSEVATIRSNFLNPANGYVVAQSNPYGFTGDKDSYPEPMLYLPNGGKVFNTSPSPSPNLGDITPPTVSLSSPINGATVTKNSTVTISANATDDVGVSKVEFYANGSLIRGCTDTSSPYSCFWKVGGKANVTYALLAKAYDLSNNSATSSIINVTSK